MQKILHERYETTALAAGPFRPGTARRPSMCELTLRQRFWAIRVAGGLFAALSLQSCASAGDETAGGIAAAKAKQLETARQQARAPFSAGEIATREVRPTTLRDSGQPDTIGYLRHVDFRFDGGVGFLVNQLTLRLVPRRPGDPVWLDDVSSYALQPVSGTVRVTADHMAALFNTVVFARGPGNDPPLRRFAFALDDSTLTMHAEMRRRGAWVSIELRGPVMLRDPQTLVFHPNDVKVRGQDAGPLLDAAHIELADLLPVSTPAVQLIGSEIVMHVPALFPPPAIQLKLTAIRVAHDDLAMQFGDGAPPLPPLANTADARRPFILFRGGDVRFMRSMPMNTRIDIVVADPARPFVFNLYHYRREAAARGITRMDADGTLRVDLAPVPAVQ
ncbi:hypothetical protein [Ralstonia pseudosolanacearum]|uniref:hypothetical protein n=1 Tax=Ralstonia pseudosolanacearum TaxID=1310165 RepID=UPI000305B6E4|nr:hypothetical protein [Ralstonia pseudosolanacearum]MDO3508308.1 hypothetical protein [Ralstonia pseudosolanacearum]MDO3512595.1 hypothetical protein [Ralstonia pseudosolanacearum]MDO3521884.1 hypothetical protein [Ralstonia pseudosolanacearum]MDO3537734.1 hypothetical protein [Ralstonia pseudosolanacearum]MDO3547915.1 hypothetical protein [Ralstonia pseudosolanacearum]